MKNRVMMAVALLFLIVLTACKNNTPSVSNEFSEIADFKNGDFDVNLIALDNFDQPVSSFQLGEEITLVLSIKNTSGTQQTLTFRNSQRVVAVFFNDDTQEIVYDFDTVYSYLQVTGENIIEPDETITFENYVQSNDLGIGNFTVNAGVALDGMDNSVLIDDEMTQFEASVQFEVQ